MVSRPFLAAVMAGAVAASAAPAAAQQPPVPPSYAPPAYAPYAAPAPYYAYPPPYWAYAPPVMERRSVAAMAAGIAMVALGNVGLIVGTSAALGARNVCDEFECTKKDGAGIALAVAGAVLTAAGIPLLVWGAGHVRAKPAEARLGAPWIAVGDPRLGAAGAAGWTFQF